MIIHNDKCEELGLPVTKGYETQPQYILRLISSGHTINTRMARYIGIGNLHSVISTLKSRKYEFTLEHGVVYCPFLQSIVNAPVDILSMTAEQRKTYSASKEKPQAA